MYMWSVYRIAEMLDNYGYTVGYLESSHKTVEKLRANASLQHRATLWSSRCYCGCDGLCCREGGGPWKREIIRCLNTFDTKTENTLQSHCFHNFHDWYSYLQASLETVVASASGDAGEDALCAPLGARVA